MVTIPPRQVPVTSVDDVPTGLGRPLGPPVPVITVTRGIDSRIQRDPARLNDASPYYATSSEAPRTP